MNGYGQAVGSGLDQAGMDDRQVDVAVWIVVGVHPLVLEGPDVGRAPAAGRHVNDAFHGAALVVVSMAAQHQLNSVLGEQCGEHRGHFRAVLRVVPRVERRTVERRDHVFHRWVGGRLLQLFDQPGVLVRTFMVCGFRAQDDEPYAGPVVSVVAPGRAVRVRSHGEVLVVEGARAIVVVTDHRENRCAGKQG